jgi:endothelin-converting enzyme
MADVNKDILHEILEGEYVGNSSLSAANRIIDKQNFQKMKTVYNSCMNQDTIKKVGVKPLRDLLDELEIVYPKSPAPNAQGSSNDELTKALNWLAKNSINAIVSSQVTVSSP